MIVDDDPGVLQAAKLYLKQHIEFVEISDNPEAVISGLKRDKYDVIFLDMNFTRNVTSGEEGFYYLKKIKTIDKLEEVELSFKVLNAVVAPKKHPEISIMVEIK